MCYTLSIDFPMNCNELERRVTLVKVDNVEAWSIDYIFIKSLQTKT